MNRNGNGILRELTVVGLSELEQVSLPLRVETKFILPAGLLDVLLGSIREHAACLELNGLRSFAYTTVYFDTAGYQLYLDHHNGYAKRLKVRVRRYDDSGECYFETKQKYTALKTLKTRRPVPGLDYMPSAADLAQISYPHLQQELQPVLRNTFRRITLCNRAFTERLTLDTGIRVSAASGSHSFGSIVVAELKQRQFDHSSPLLNALRQLPAREVSFSKYALGVAVLQPMLKQNNFKPILSLLKYYQDAPSY